MGRDLYGNPQRAIAGQQFGLTGHTRTYVAGEKIYPGDPVFGMVGDNERCYGAHINAVTLTAAAALVTGNKVAATVKGVTLPVVEFVESTGKTLEKVVQAAVLILPNFDPVNKEKQQCFQAVKLKCPKECS